MFYYNFKIIRLPHSVIYNANSNYIQLLFIFRNREYVSTLVFSNK